MQYYLHTVSALHQGPIPDEDITTAPPFIVCIKWCCHHYVSPALCISEAHPAQKRGEKEEYRAESHESPDDFGKLKNQR